MANNRIAYGLAKQHGIDTTGMSPKQVWDALKEKGINQENFSNDKISEYNDLSVEELKERQTIDLSKKKVSLSKSEWARFYERLGGIKKGENVEKLSNGKFIIPLHKMNDEDKPKMIVFSGTYVKPIIAQVFEFDTEEEMFDYLNWEK